MDTMKDTKMQPATDAVIDTLRKMQPAAWVYEDMLGRKCVGFERPFPRRNTHEPLFSAAGRTAVMGLVNRLEEAEKERDNVAQQLVQSEIGKREISEAHNAVTGRLSVLADENTALRAKIAEMEQQKPVAAQHRFRHPQKTMPNWSIWQSCAISNRPAWAIDSQGYEVEYIPLYTLPGAKGESE